MRRTWEQIPRAPGPQFVQDKTTGQHHPNVILFTDYDKGFLRSVGWDPTKVVTRVAK